MKKVKLFLGIILCLALVIGACPMALAADLIKEMEYKKLTNQFSFHTEKAIDYLRKEGIEIV